MPLKNRFTHLEYNSQISLLIYANHILHYHGLVDAFGHISIRHPLDPKQYIIPGYVAPALVADTDDLIEYWVEDGSPVHQPQPKGYSERFIHGEIFKRFPEVNCVIHSHSEAVIPFSIAGVPLRPVYHMGGFLGECAPTFDITQLYKDMPGHQQDMLVNNSRLGSGLAHTFVKAERGYSANTPDFTVALMRHHGFTCIGSNIEDAVYRAIYTQKNAMLQSSAANLRSSISGSHASDVTTLDYLTEEEAAGCKKMNEATADKAFRLWLHEVDTMPLYKNKYLLRLAPIG